MFELNDEIIHQIIFAMENQNDRFLVEVEDGTVVQASDIDPDELPEDLSIFDPNGRYQPVPAWESADGFQLMEQFVSQLYNPVAREELQGILSSGKRVFRRFKDQLQQYPALEKKWHVFKFRSMRKPVIQWYNTLREVAGLEALELGHDEEVDALVGSEFSVQPIGDKPLADSDRRRVMELDSLAAAEAYTDVVPEPVYRLWWTDRIKQLPEPDASSSLLLGAYTPLGEDVGFLWSVERSNDPRVWVIEQLYVQPEYRGLGIATMLLGGTIEQARQAGVQYLCLGSALMCRKLESLYERLEFTNVEGFTYLSLEDA